MVTAAESDSEPVHREEPGIWSGRFAGGIVVIVLAWYITLWLGLAVYTGFNWPRVIIAAGVAGAAGTVGGIAGFRTG